MAVVAVAAAVGAAAAVQRQKNGVRISKRQTGQKNYVARQQSESSDVLEFQQVAEAKDELFNWNKAWYPLAVIEDLDPGRPNKLVLLGEDLVAWKDGESQWRVFEDRCPHRNVPLSEGRVESDGTLLCSYHGWHFNGDGRVTSIPQAPAQRVEALLANKRACASVRPAQVRLGVLWVWGESGENAALEAALKEPNLPKEAEDPALADRVKLTIWSHRDLPYGWEVAMENVTDPGHVAVAHHNVVANRYTDPSPLKIDWVRKPTNQEGFCIKITSANMKPGMEPSTMDFRPPCQMHIRQPSSNGASLTLIINFVPTKPGWSRLVGTTMLTKNEKGETGSGFGIYSAPLPRWLMHILAPVFLHQDQVFLHHQQAILQKQELKTGQNWMKSYWIPTEADKGTVELRRWLDRNGGVGWSKAVSTALAAMPDKSLLFDTYKTHTCQCTTCAKALRRTERAQGVLKYSAIAMASAALSTASWPLLAGGAVLGAGAVAAGKLRKMFYEVPFHHQDNN